VGTMPKTIRAAITEKATMCFNFRFISTSFVPLEMQTLK
jgi:hypothetical protein